MLPIFDETENNEKNPVEAVRLIIENINELKKQLYTYLTTLDGANFAENVEIDNLTVKSFFIGDVSLEDKIQAMIDEKISELGE